MERANFPAVMREALAGRPIALEPLPQPTAEQERNERLARWTLRKGLYGRALDRVGLTRVDLRRAVPRLLSDEGRRILERARGAGRSLYLHGPAGTGKSYLAACILGAWLRDQRDVLSRHEDLDGPEPECLRGVPDYCDGVRWVPCERYLADLQSSFPAQASETMEVIVDRHVDHRRIVFDDLFGLGCSRVTAWQVDEVGRLFDRRQADARRVTVVTCNLAPEALAESLARAGSNDRSSSPEQAALTAERLLSRILAKDCGFDVIAIKGRDRRLG